jgi:hypothetical protein
MRVTEPQDSLFEVAGPLVQSGNAFNTEFKEFRECTMFLKYALNLPILKNSMNSLHSLNSVPSGR